MAKLLYFGRLSDTTGCAEETRKIPNEVTDTLALRRWLDAELNSTNALSDKSVRIAINSDIVIDPHPISDDDEIAFLPPVGGG